MSFLRRIEDFVCDRCGKAVSGDGYTNHCPKCLWSKHVDTEPGDRLALCRGMMDPILIERKGDEWILTHECVTCGHRKRNKMDRKDELSSLEISQKIF